MCAKKLNASECADYLEVSRSRFYAIKKKYNLTPCKREGIISYYDSRRLDKIKTHLLDWWVKRGKRRVTRK
jgi:hypothetical protein